MSLAIKHILTNDGYILAFIENGLLRHLSKRAQILNNYNLGGLATASSVNLKGLHSST